MRLDAVKMPEVAMTDLDDERIFCAVARSRRIAFLAHASGIEATTAMQKAENSCAHSCGRDHRPALIQIQAPQLSALNWANADLFGQIAVD
jgi:hypothetical protein